MDHEPVIENSELKTCFKALDSVWDVFKDNYGETEASISNEDFVTETDGLIEDRIVRCIKDDYQNTSFLSEEMYKKSTDDGIESDTEVQWIIDPIDGTINYFRGSLPAGISIFAEVDGELQSGVIGLPNQDTVFYSVKGHGTYMNETQVECSDKTDISNSVVDMQFGESRIEIDGYTETVNRLSRQARQIVCSRTGVYDFCMISDGRLDAAINLETNPWDVAGAYLLVNEAGGQVTDRKGRTDWRSVKKGDAVASNGGIHEDLIKDF